MKVKIPTFLLFLFVLMSTSLAAQNEVETELFSLSGISEFGISVNIEKPVGFKEPSLNVADIQNKIEESFESLPVKLLNFNQLKESFYNPFFYVHVNIMQADGGIYPFSIEMRFYQPVKLSLKNDVETMASTWHSGYVGMVSYDRTDEIAGVVLEATNEFKEQLEKFN